MYRFFFDVKAVEPLGLAFAAGVVVVDNLGIEEESRLFFCKPKIERWESDCSCLREES
jgi:hypothetical protein